MLVYECSFTRKFCNRMAGLLYSCVVLLGCVATALAVLNVPCNDQYTECGAGECCATTIGAPEGFKGVCQKYKKANEPCTVVGPKDGECGCPRWMICANPFHAETATCNIILPRL